jgi:hypothetical protein
MQGDESSCKATLDQNGEACEWCVVSSVNLCLTSDQAEIAEQLGGDCGDGVETEDDEFVSDPYDTSCLAASMQGDESPCKATLDLNGEACEWCVVSSVNLCLTSDQVKMAEQLGGSCNGRGDLIATRSGFFY